MGSPDRSALEALWRKRVHEAQLRLSFARNYAKEVQKDLSSDSLSVPVEPYEPERARRAETAALAEYARILAIFTDLTVHGKIPNENDWPSHKTAGEGE